MTDKKDQTESETPDKYKALIDGIWGKAGTVFSPVEPGGIFGDASVAHFYAVNGTSTPIISIGLLMDSPDFERVVEYWEPVDGELYFLVSGTHIRPVIDPFNFGISNNQYYNQAVNECTIFRTRDDAQNFINEADELIKKRSEESRRLK